MATRMGQDRGVKAKACVAEGRTMNSRRGRGGGVGGGGRKGKLR